jgi:hypothetical protein
MPTASGSADLSKKPNPPDTDHHVAWNEAMKGALEDVKEKQKTGEWPTEDIEARVIRHITVTGNPGDIKTYRITLDTDK